MTVLLQVSDPHFGTERPAVVHALERFAHALKPDVLLLSGDITQRATAAQFAAARAFVDRLAVPVRLVIPGNHDIPLFNVALRLLAPYARFRRAFGHDLQPHYECADVLVVAVNTTRSWRHADGQVSAAQIEQVAQRLLAAQPGQCRVVLVHQPVAVTRLQDHHNLLHGHDAAVQRWAAAGADLVVGGHIHLPYVVPVRPRPARPVWAVQAGTAVSWRVRADAGNSVNVIRIGADVEAGATAELASSSQIGGDGPDQPSLSSASARRFTIERWDHLTTSDRFERVQVHRLA
jgi:3',5'-cyclic AMP phosphodiesterase CpdA